MADHVSWNIPNKWVQSIQIIKQNCVNNINNNNSTNTSAIYRRLNFPGSAVPFMKPILLLDIKRKHFNALMIIRL